QPLTGNSDRLVSLGCFLESNYDSMGLKNFVGVHHVHDEP
ncbi:24914_t:CDS:1, partial [Racocetra persica]